jgi:two-component system chemotaxis response regulator CheY
MTTSYLQNVPSARPIPPTLSPTVLSLLIVDEDRFLREACREAVKALGYSARTTSSSEQAFSLVESEKIDAVFLAAKGPDFLSTLNVLKDKRPGVEIIAVTNDATVRFCRRCDQGRSPCSRGRSHFCCGEQSPEGRRRQMQSN